MGLSSIPSIAETIQIKRDISILEYTGGKIHIPYISSSESIEIIRSAKKNGLNISTSVPIANLIFNDEILDGFNSNYKLFPPIRDKEDQKMLKEGVLDGTIDIVTSHHQPINPEFKQVDFNSAEYGTISLEIMFGLLNKIFSIEKVIDLLTKGRSIFNLEKPKIEEKQKTQAKPETEKTKPKKVEIQDPPDKTQQAQKSQQITTSKINAELLSKQLSIYLGKISEEINLIAAKSYPRQSIKIREQGTIIATITLNKDGNLRNIDFDKKKPKRLYKTTEKIFKKYVFPKPPENILNNQKLVKFKISVNFILK